MVRVPVAFCDATVARFAQRFCEGVVHRSEAFVCSDDEGGTRRNGWREIVHIERRLMIVNLARERFATGPGERQEIVVARQVFGLILNRGHAGGAVVA